MLVAFVVDGGRERGVVKNYTFLKNIKKLVVKKIFNLKNAE